MPQPARDQVFISYSHKDKKWRDDLDTHLKPYLRGGSIVSWSDQQIAPGSEWFKEIQSALANSKVAVLLVSPDFLASDFIHEHELGPLLKEAEQGGVKVLWVPLYASAYKQIALKNYQAALSPDTPLGGMPKAKRVQAWVKICEEIERAVNSPDQLRDRLPTAERRERAEKRRLEAQVPPVGESLPASDEAIVSDSTIPATSSPIRPAEVAVGLRTLEGHTNQVACVAFSPDGTLVASGSDDKTVRLWRVSDGGLARTLEGGPIRCVAFSPDGALVASGSDDKTVRLWRVSDGELLWTLEGHSHYVRGVAFSPDEALVASGSDDKTTRLWRVSDGELLRTLGAHSASVRGVAFSPDGALVASGSDDRTVRLWRASDGGFLRTLEGHSNSVTCVAFSPDGALVASGSDDFTVRLWRVSDGRLLWTLKKHSQMVVCVAFSPDGLTLASGTYVWFSVPELYVWRVATGMFLKSLSGHTESINGVAFSPDGALLVSGSSDKTVRLWALTTGLEELECGRLLTAERRERAEKGRFEAQVPPVGASLPAADETIVSDSIPATSSPIRPVEAAVGLRTLEGHTNQVAGVAFSPDGTLVASGSDDKTVRLWRMSDGGLARTLEGGPIRCVAFSPDGALVASGSDDKTVRLWRVSDGELLPTVGGHSASVRGVAFSPDGALVASGSDDKTVRQWRVSDGELLRALEGHSASVRGVAFSPDGALVASGSDDRTVRLWRASDGGFLRTLEGHSNSVTCVAFSPGGALVASGSDDFTVRLWRVSDGRLLWTLKKHSQMVVCVAFSPDGLTLASGTYVWFSVPELYVWRVATGMFLKSLSGHTESINGVAFSPDGALLASGSSDKTVRLWPEAENVRQSALRHRRNAAGYDRKSVR